MNFVFDVGNVLLDFKPSLYLQKLFSDRPTEEKMYKTIFKSDEWVKLDLGVITRREACDIFCSREPDFKTAIVRTMDNMHELLTPISATIELLPKIKESGNKLFYLSNYSKEGKDYATKAFGFFAMFDGGVFSCDVHFVKPSPEIYHFFLDKYQLSAKDCLYFDDVIENVEAAQKIGFNAVLFTGIECVLPYLENMSFSPDKC